MDDPKLSTTIKNSDEGTIVFVVCKALDEKHLELFYFENKIKVIYFEDYQLYKSVSSSDRNDCKAEAFDKIQEIDYNCASERDCTLDKLRNLCNKGTQMEYKVCAGDSTKLNNELKEK